MMLYLLRHAEAESVALNDNARRLTLKGEQQARRVGKFCRLHELAPPLILASPVARARQTAQLVAEHLGEAELIEAPWAECGMDPAAALHELRGYVRFPSVMLVGHQPDLGRLAAMLLGMESPDSLHLRKSLLAAIDCGENPRAGLGALEFFLPAKLMD